MIAEALRTELAQRFPELSSLSNEGGLVMPAAHEAVGDVTISDDGNEATLCIGTITHGHFNDFREGVSPEAAARTIAEDVVSFLEALLADRVLLWRSDDAGGWRILDTDEKPNVHSDSGTQFYLWSGPIG